MGVSHGNQSIVTGGLWTCIDANNPACYSGSTNIADSAIIYDLSGNGNNWTTNVNSSGDVVWGYDSLAPDTKAFTFTKSSDTTSEDTQNTMLSPATGLKNTTNDYTLMCGTRYTTSVSANSKRVLAGKPGTNWMLGHHGNQTGRCYFGGWIHSTDTGLGTAWAIYTTTRDGSADEQSFWQNDTKLTTDSDAGQDAGQPDIISLGGGQQVSEYSDCAGSFVILYNRILSDSEVLQNYNTLKGRFGL